MQNKAEALDDTSINYFVQEKNKLYKQWLLNKSIKSLEKYKLYKNKQTHLLRIIEKEYYNNRFLAVKKRFKTYMERNKECHS